MVFLFKFINTAFLCNLLVLNYFSISAPALYFRDILLIETILELICIAVRDNDKFHIEALAEIKKHIYFQFLPITLHWLDDLFVLFISVGDGLRLFIETSEWVRIIDLFLFHPVVHQDAIFTSWIAEVMPNPLVNRTIKLRYLLRFSIVLSPRSSCLLFFYFFDLGYLRV